MKKITLLTIMLLFSLISFSQSLGPELVTNGDFESPSTAPWYSGGGAGLNVVEIAGNRLNQKNVTAAGTAFSVNISQVIVLDSGKEYRLTYDAYTNLASRPIVVGLGQSAGSFSAVVVTQTITNTSTTYSHDLTIGYGDAVTDRVIFDIGAATGTVFLDNVSVREVLPAGPPVNDVTGDVYINDGTFAAGDFTAAAGQDIASNDGSAAEPFATLDYALARSTQAPGDVIYIDAGTYSWASTHALTDSGTLANPITIQGKGNNETNITTTAASTTSAGLHFTTGEHWVVKDLNWTATAARAVWVDNVDGIILDNCTINMTNAITGVNALQSIIINNAGGELTIKNSRLTRSNTAFHIVEVVEGTTLIMQDNRVSFSALVSSGTASSVQLRTNASSLFIIERNKFVNGGYGIGNVAGTAGPVNANSIIKNNFFNSYWGIVTTIVQGLTVHNNSFYTNGESIYGINAGSLTNWDIRNNILYTYGTSRACVMSGSTTSHPAIMDYNHYYSPITGAARQGSTTGPILSFTQWQNAAGGPWEQNGQGGNAATFDPLYVDPANGDLHLQPGSPAIGAGVDVGITDDIDGDARPLSGSFDMGADEYTVIISTDATLSALEVSEGTLVPGFSPAITEYAVVASSASSIPQITTATPTSLAASVVITQAPSVFEDSTIVVTAEDGITTETYTVRIGLVTSDIIQDFESPATYTGLTSDNGTLATIQPSPAGIDGNSLRLVSRSTTTFPAAQTFQAGFFDQVSDFVVLTPESNTVQVDVYSTQAFNLRLKLEEGAAPIERTVQYTTPNTWQTLTFNFGAVTATYSRIVFFLNSNATNDGFLAAQDFTAFVDNIALSSIQTDRLVYTYENGVWTPESPVGISTALDNILVIDGNPGIDGLIEVNDVEVASAASLDISSTGVLKLSGDIINNGNITFQSDANGSAQLDIFNGLITGSGDVTVERYILAKRAYRLLTTSLNNAGSINANWQEGAVTTALGNGNPNPGFGTHITGGTAANGFDQNGSGAVSMFTFDNTFPADQPGEAQIDAWSAVDNTLNTNLSAGVPYLTFVRGDRTTDLNNSSDPATETTLRATGEIHTGPLTFDLSQVPEFYSLVGNPYQSVVDFDQVTRNDLTNFIYVWDTSIGTRGAYVSVELPLGNNEILPPVAGTSDASQFIPPGASFFVENSASGPITPSLTFNENNKVTGANQVTIFNAYPHFYINSRLYSTSDLQSGNTERDAIGIRFLDDYTTLGSDEDATKLGNPDENYAIINNGLRSIDKQAMPNIGHQIDLSINGYTETQYSLIFNIQNQPGGLGVFLNDAYLNTQVELTSASVYDFSIDETISESIAADRFSLSFDNTTLSVEDNVFGSDFNLFPNPTQDGRFSIKTNGLNTDDVIVTMHNMLGQQVYAERLTPENDGIINVNASRLSAGIYVLELSQNGQSFTQKVIVE